MPAANLALEDVNSNKDLLPGYKLRLHSNDSEVSGKRMCNWRRRVFLYVMYNTPEIASN